MQVQEALVILGVKKLTYTCVTTETLLTLKVKILTVL